MKKTLKLCGLYLLVTLVVALGVIFLMPLPVSASDEADWEDPVLPAPDNHLLDIVGNLMTLHDANVTANLTIVTNGQQIDLTAAVDLQATDGFTDVAVAGDLDVRVNDFATTLHLTYLAQTIYADWNNLHLSVGTTDLINGLPTLLGLFDVKFTLPDFGDLDVNALLGILEDYTETDNGNGFDVVLTVAGCDLQLTCDADFNLQHAVIPELTFGDTTIAGEIALTTYDTALAITTPEPADTYVDIPQLLKFFGDLIPTFNHPFAFTGNATIFATADGNPQLDNYLSADFGRLAVATQNGLLDQLAIEIAVNGMGDLFQDMVDGRALNLGAYFNSDNTNGGVYINFDGLQLFCAKAALADTYAALQHLLGLFVGDDILQYTNLLYFNDNNDMVFDQAVLAEIMGDLSVNDIVTLLDTYLPYLQGLSLTADNVLTLTLANNLLTLTIEPTADGAYQISIDIYLAEQNREIVATFTLQTVDAFTGEPENTTTYLDVSDISTLLDALNNTVRYQEFYLTGTIHLSVASLLTVDVPMEVAINNTDPERGLVVAAHFALPYSGLPKLVLDDAPSAAGKTKDGTRDVYLYYQQGDIYLYRTEQVKLTQGGLWGIGAKTVYEGSYEKAVKLTLTQFMDDAVNWLLQWGFGFNNTIMNEINKAVANSGNNNDPLNYGDIVHGFTYNNGRYDIVLNLGEIAHNPDLKDFTVSITTAAGADDQTLITDIGLDLQISTVVKIVVQTKGAGLKLTCGEGVADVTTALDRMLLINNEYQDKSLTYGQTCHTIQGVWQAA